MADEINERRSGDGRRKMDCIQPCTPIVEELDKRDTKLEKILENKDKEVHKKLDSIFTCLGTKIPSALFWRIVYGLGILVFVVGGAGIGGTLWGIYGMVSEVKTDVKVMGVTVNNTSIDLKSHMARASTKHDEFDSRLDDIEKGETFYNFYKKQHPIRSRE